IYRVIDAVLTDESNRQIIEESYPKRSMTPRNTGYALAMLAEPEQPVSLCRLLAGSEGTVGIHTEVNLNLRHLPPKEIRLLRIDCHALIESLHANVTALAHQPEASELVDKYILDFTKGHPTYQYNRFFIEGDPEALLMVEFRGDTLDEVENKAAAL